MENLTIVDCTLRDGGFYNRWDFTDRLIRDYVTSASGIGLDVIEYGYRSVDASSYAGPCRYSPDSLLDALPPLGRTRIAVMIETREYCRAGGIVDAAAIMRQFRPATQSRISLVRVATHLTDLDATLEIVSRLGEHGYACAINLMQVSGMADDVVSSAADHARQAGAEVFYLADSLGRITPDEMRRLGSAVHATGVPWGVHCHDNLQLALSNTLAAIESGASYADATILGMGRGAGNTRTETLLHLLNADGRYDLSRLADVISTHFEPLHRRYAWGASLPFLLSSAYGLHPTYAQELLALDRYTTAEVVSILEQLARGDAPHRFRADGLEAAISTRLGSIDGFVPVAARFDLAAWRARAVGRPVLVVGRGPSVAQRAGDLNAYIARHDPVVIECNHQPELAAAATHLSVFVRYETFQEQAAQTLAGAKTVVVGFERAAPALLTGADRVHYFPYRVDRTEFDCVAAGCVVPFDVVSMYALAIAAGLGATEVRLAGFDGYDGQSGHAGRRRQDEMQYFFDMLTRVRPDLSLRSLTPTSYDVPQGSLYFELLG